MHFPRILLAYPLSFQKQESEIDAVCLFSAAEMSRMCSKKIFFAGI